MINRRYNLFAVLALSAALALTVGCFLFSGNGSEADVTSPPAGATAECRVDVITQGMGQVTIECASGATVATLTAIPAEGWRFDRWLGIGASGNTATVATGGSGTITAVFVSLDDGLLDPAGDLDPDDTADREDDDDQDQDDGDDDGDDGDDDQDQEIEPDLVRLTICEGELDTICVGKGSGLYERGEVVSITANVPVFPPGMQFDVWIIGNPEFIEKGNAACTSAIGCKSIKVTMREDIRLIARFVLVLGTQPPTIEVALPAEHADPTDPLNFVVFDTENINITIDAELSQGPTDNVDVFAIRDVFPLPTSADGLPDDTIDLGTAFSSTTLFAVDVTLLKRGIEYKIGATIDDGLNTTGFDLAPGTLRRSTLPQILWVGSIDPPLGAPQQNLPGMILEGVNFEDNAGSAFAAGEDFTGDGIDDFFVLARYAKPRFENPQGIGVGEAYLIAGSQNRRLGRFNLNSTGLLQLPGVVFTGIEPPFFTPTTEGLTDLLIIPDVDGDNVAELAFGVPNITSASRGALELAGQFQRGGIVIVSSQTSTLSATTSDARISLHDVGQRFVVEAVIPEPEIGPLCRDAAGQAYLVDSGGWFVDMQSYEDGELDDGPPPVAVSCGGCVGSRPDPTPDGLPDTWVQPSFGFVPALAPPFNINRCQLVGDCPSNEVQPGDPQPDPDPTGCPIMLTIGPSSLSCTCSALCQVPCSQPPATGPCCSNVPFSIGSGFYPDNIAIGVPNAPFSPLGLGARILGKNLGDRFGTSITISGSDLIVSAPLRSGSSGETPALLPPGTVVPNSGVAYIFNNDAYWLGVPPKPHQYMIDTASHFGAPPPNAPRRGGIGALTIVGQANQNIENLLGIDDFNRDSRVDIAVGAPNANSQDGLVYIAFRRAAPLEGDYVLNNLTLAPSDPQRLVGVLIRGETNSQFGASLTSTLDFDHDGKLGFEGDQELDPGDDGIIDFNGDGISDLVVGAPGADGGVGEVYVIFGGTFINTPAGGAAIQDLIDEGNAVRISGSTLDTDGAFGFNIANAGDVDGDGTNDLLVAAPNATPRFDTAPFDLVDDLYADPLAQGLDLDHDGARDDVTGPRGIPDGPTGSSTFDKLPHAGLVYLILGSNDLSNLTDGEINIDQLGTTKLEGAIFVGRRGDRGDQKRCVAGANDGATCTNNPSFCSVADAAGNLGVCVLLLAGDHLGGGDAGGNVDPNSNPSNDVDRSGGNPHKFARGRSRGLAGIGDIDGDGKDDFAIGAVLADVRVDPTSPDGAGDRNAGEAYIIYGFEP
ncbi:MAG: hypothetical protein V3W34_13045 [Phycisphaerae bacterium]